MKERPGVVSFAEEISNGRFDLVIWDFDGAIADTEPVQAEAYRLLLEQEGRHVNTHFFRELMGRTEPEIWQHLKDKHHLSIDIDVATQRRLAIFRELAQQLVPNDFAVTLLKYHQAEHRVISSGNLSIILHLLDRWHLLTAFSVVAAYEPMNPRQPSKEERLRQAIGSAKDPGRVLVVEDSPRYLQIARELGARTLGVSHGMNNLNKAQADRIVDVQ